MLSEISQSQKKKLLHDTIYMRLSRIIRLTEAESEMMLVRNRREGSVGVIQ